jgi:hypothetical protein
MGENEKGGHLQFGNQLTAKSTKVSQRNAKLTNLNYC